ncbi:MAG TPA: DUF6152 family protein, partial [Xanthobacteraceae bacterium]
MQEFRYVNPHAFIILKVKEKDGHVASWTLEGQPTAMLEREGWTRNTLKPGDQIPGDHPAAAQQRGWRRMDPARASLPGRKDGRGRPLKHFPIRLSHSSSSPAGLTRGSIAFAKRWIVFRVHPSRSSIAVGWPSSVQDATWP